MELREEGCRRVEGDEVVPAGRAAHGEHFAVQILMLPLGLAFQRQILLRAQAAVGL
jgi:hypothetical protein